MANLRKCSRCKSEIDISYFGMSRKKEAYKTCDNCRNTNKKISKPTQADTNVITIDDEIKECVLQLLSTYSTDQLDRVMAKHKSKHVLAHAEAKLKRTDTTFRDLSADDVFPVIMELNNMADHAPSDDDNPRMTARSMFNPSDYYQGCVEFRPNGDMVGFRD